MITPCGPQYGNGKGLHARPAGSAESSPASEDVRGCARTSASGVESLVDDSAALREEARASEDADTASTAVRRRNERNMRWCGSSACGVWRARALFSREKRRAKTVSLEPRASRITWLEPLLLCDFAFPRCGHWTSDKDMEV